MEKHQSSGRIEIFHRILRQGICKISDNKNLKQTNMAHIIGKQYNNTMRSAIKTTPV